MISANDIPDKVYNYPLLKAEGKFCHCLCPSGLTNSHFPIMATFLNSQNTVLLCIQPLYNSHLPTVASYVTFQGRLHCIFVPIPVITVPLTFTTPRSVLAKECAQYWLTA